MREAGSKGVRSAYAEADLAATSRVSYTEARSALARRCREGGLSERGLRKAVSDLDRIFADLLVIEVGEETARDAGELAESHALRAFDAVHLASALALRSYLDAPPLFLSFDDRLRRAAEAEGLPT